MIESYIWLTPVIVLAALLLFRFVGCLIAPDRPFSDDPLRDVILADEPVGYWPFQETDQSTVGGTFGLVAHAVAASTGGASAAVTPAIDSTGATLLVLSVTDFDRDSTTDTVSDSFRQLMALPQ